MAITSKKGVVCLDKRIFALAIVVMVLTIPSASAVSPTVSDHRNFVGGFSGWETTPSTGTWTINADNQAVAKVNSSVSSASIGFDNWTDLSSANLTQKTEIDFEWQWSISADYVITDNNPIPVIKIEIYENTSKGTLKASISYEVKAYRGNSISEISIDQIDFTIYKGTTQIATTYYYNRMGIWSNYSSGQQYKYKYKSSIYQINYDEKTYWYLHDITGYHKLETDFYKLTSVKPEAIVYHPSFAPENFTFYFDYFNLDAYSQTIHKEIVNETPEQEKPFSLFDVIPLPNLSFAILLISIFILSVSEKVKIPEEIGYLALLSALAVIFYSIANYYSGDDMLSALAGLSPYMGYPLKDRFLNRKKMLK